MGIRFSFEKYFNDIEYVKKMKVSYEPFRKLYVEIITENLYPMVQLLMAGSSLKNAVENTVFNGILGEMTRELWKTVDENYEEILKNLEQEYVTKFKNVSKKDHLEMGDVVVFLDKNTKRWKVMDIHSGEIQGEPVYKFEFEEVDVGGDLTGRKKGLYSESVNPKELGCYIVLEEV